MRTIHPFPDVHVRNGRADYRRTLASSRSLRQGPTRGMVAGSRSSPRCQRRACSWRPGRRRRLRCSPPGATSRRPAAPCRRSRRASAPTSARPSPPRRGLRYRACLARRRAGRRRTLSRAPRNRCARRPCRPPTPLPTALRTCGRPATFSAWSVPQTRASRAGPSPPGASQVVPRGPCPAARPPTFPRRSGPGSARATGSALDAWQRGRHPSTSPCTERRGPAWAAFRPKHPSTVVVAHASRGRSPGRLGVPAAALPPGRGSTAPARGPRGRRPAPPEPR
mmetsp:Transcript_126253/g.363154  ORF Transcript_126253/g.363154 Transcript_126253/m.363154 type:complete len:280 (-) Transcript_126253:439-1278(-)